MSSQRSFLTQAADGGIAVVRALERAAVPQKGTAESITLSTRGFDASSQQGRWPSGCITSTSDNRQLLDVRDGCSSPDVAEPHRDSPILVYVDGGEALH